MTTTYATIQNIPVSQIVPGKNDRTDFHQARLEELAASIQTNGLAQPITVRPIAAEHYEIIAGERRFRAVAQILKHKTIPCIVRPMDDEMAAILFSPRHTPENHGTLVKESAPQQHVCQASVPGCSGGAYPPPSRRARTRRAISTRSLFFCGDSPSAAHKRRATSARASATPCTYPRAYFLASAIRCVLFRLLGLYRDNR